MLPTLSNSSALLTDIITWEWSGMTTKQYKSFKGLKKESLRDNMTFLLFYLYSCFSSSNSTYSPSSFANILRLA